MRKWLPVVLLLSLALASCGNPETVPENEKAAELLTDAAFQDDAEVRTGTEDSGAESVVAEDSDTGNAGTKDSDTGNIDAETAVAESVVAEDFDTGNAGTKDSDTESIGTEDSDTGNVGAENGDDGERGETAMANQITVTFHGHTYSAAMEDNSSVSEFLQYLADNGGSVTISASDYGSFEKVGALGTGITRNDRQITTTPGDIILYQGTQITVYYAENSWNFTRLGRLTGDLSHLREDLGDGDVEITFALEE